MGDETTTKTTDQTTKGYGPALAQADNVLSTAGTLANNQQIWQPTQSQGTVGGIQGLNQVGQQGSAALGGLNSTFQGASQGFGVGNQGLQQTASGANLNHQSPQFQQALNNASQNTADDVQRQFEGAGRYGSAADTRTLADRIGQQRTSAEVGQYNLERGYQNQAQGQLQQGGFQGANQSGNLQDAQTFGAKTQLAGGAIQDAHDAASRLAPVTANQYLQSAAYPGAALGSTQQGTTTETKESNPLTTALGIGATGLGILSGNPFLAAGGLGGLLGGGSGRQINGSNGLSF